MAKTSKCSGGVAGWSVALLIALLGVGVASSGCSRAIVLRWPSGVLEPRIVPSSTQSGTQVVQRGFDFEATSVQLRVPVDKAIYAGSVSSPKAAVFIGGADPGNWVPGYYRAFVEEGHQTAFIDAAVTALRMVRTQQKLDSAGYVELVTSMVQELEYRVDPVNLAPKFPIETFTDGYGDCDDKTLLAAALLSHEGYDVSILLFAPEKHVALGIRAPGLDYGSTGYAYVEMTQPSLVGIPPELLAGGVRLTSRPVAIRIGSGKGAFTASDRIAYIRTRLQEVKAARGKMGDQIAGDKADLAAKRASLDAAKPGVQGPTATAAAVKQYNAMVERYNAGVSRLDGLIARYNVLVGVERFVAEHQTARDVVYRRLRDLKL